MCPSQTTFTTKNKVATKLFVKTKSTAKTNGLKLSIKTRSTAKQKWATTCLSERDHQQLAIPHPARPPRGTRLVKQEGKPLGIGTKPYRSSTRSKRPIPPPSNSTPGKKKGMLWALGLAQNRMTSSVNEIKTVDSALLVENAWKKQWNAP